MLMWQSGRPGGQALKQSFWPEIVFYEEKSLWLKMDINNIYAFYQARKAQMQATSQFAGWHWRGEAKHCIFRNTL